MQLIQRFGRDINIIGLYPVIVKHIYNKRYLNKRSKFRSDTIFSGDRSNLILNENSRKVLKALINNPTEKTVYLAEKTGLNIRTVIKTRKKLEEVKVIRGYSVTLNHKRLGIKSCLILIAFKYIKPKEIDRLIEYSSNVPEITAVIKIMGQYNLLVRIESLNSYQPTLNAMREEFGFFDYNVYEVGNIMKNTYIPVDLLDNYHI